MAINFTDITDTQKLEISDLLSKVESINGSLADIQTVRVTAEIGYAKDEQELEAEKNKVLETIRNLRTTSIVK